MGCIEGGEFGIWVGEGGLVMGGVGYWGTGWLEGDEWWCNGWVVVRGVFISGVFGIRGVG